MLKNLQNLLSFLISCLPLFSQAFRMNFSKSKELHVSTLLYLVKNPGFDCSIASRCLSFLMFATFLVTVVTCIGMESGNWQVLH